MVSTGTSSTVVNITHISSYLCQAGKRKCKSVCLSQNPKTETETVTNCTLLLMRIAHVLTGRDAVVVLCGSRSRTSW